MRLVQKIWVVLACAALAGCYTTRVRKPATAPFEGVDRDQFWETAIAVLQDEGYSIDTIDRDAGFVKTAVTARPSAQCGILPCSVRESVTVTMVTGRVRVDINRQFLVNADSGWYDSPVESFVLAVERDQRSLLKRITSATP